MTMLRHNHNQQLHNRKFNLTRWNFIKTGLLLISLAICFIAERSYFFYPPQLAPTWNNIYLDIAGLVAGLILLLCGTFDLKNNVLIKLGLDASAVFLAVLLVAEMFHVAGINYFRLLPTIILEIYAVINLVQIAYEYNPES